MPGFYSPYRDVFMKHAAFVRKNESQLKWLRFHAWWHPMMMLRTRYGTRTYQEHLESRVVALWCVASTFKSTSGAIFLAHPAPPRGYKEEMPLSQISDDKKFWLWEIPFKLLKASSKLKGFHRLHLPDEFRFDFVTARAHMCHAVQ